MTRHLSCKTLQIEGKAKGLKSNLHFLLRSVRLKESTNHAICHQNIIAADSNFFNDIHLCLSSLSVCFVQLDELYLTAQPDLR